MMTTNINRYIENISDEHLKNILDVQNKEIIVEDIDSFIEVIKGNDSITQCICLAESKTAKILLKKLINIFCLNDINIDELYEFIKLNATFVMARNSNWKTSEISLINNDIKHNTIKCYFSEFKYINKWNYEENRKIYKIMYCGENIVWLKNKCFDYEPQCFIIRHGKTYGIEYSHKYLTIYKNIEDSFKEISINNLDDIITEYENTKFDIAQSKTELSEYFNKGFFYKGVLWDRSWSKEISRMKNVCFVEGLLKIEIENLTYPHTGYILYEIETDKVIKAEIMN